MGLAHDRRNKGAGVVEQGARRVESYSRTQRNSLNITYALSPSLVHVRSSLDNDWRVQPIAGPALWDSARHRAPVAGSGGALWRQVV